MWTLSDDLEAFYLEHRRCGELDSGFDGERVWMGCSCGAVIVRSAEPVGRPGTPEGRACATRILLAAVHR